jgi:hypothetical protein
MPRQTVESFLSKLKKEREVLDSIILAVESRLQHHVQPVAHQPVHKPVGHQPAKKKGMSEATKAKLRAIMKARWAQKQKQGKK